MQRSVPIQPKTRKILTNICQQLATALPRKGSEDRRPEGRAPSRALRLKGNFDDDQDCLPGKENCRKRVQKTKTETNEKWSRVATKVPGAETTHDLPGASDIFTLLSNSKIGSWYSRERALQSLVHAPFLFPLPCLDSLQLRKVPRLPDGRKPLRAAECQKCGKAFMLEGPHRLLGDAVQTFLRNRESGGGAMVCRCRCRKTALRRYKIGIFLRISASIEPRTSRLKSDHSSQDLGISRPADRLPDGPARVSR